MLARGDDMATLNGMKVAILVTEGFEQDELLKPRKALDEAGADTKVVSPQDETVRGWKLTDWGDTVMVDQRLNEANPDQFDALLLPGGVMNPDKLRTDPRAVQFIKSFFEAGKPVAAICHGPWTVVEAGEARGRKLTSWPSLKTDLRNAGAEWFDNECVVDGNLVSSRKPDDIPAFNRAMIEVFNRGQLKPVPPSSSADGQDAHRHVRRIKRMLDEAAAHAREDIEKISDPKAKALFETTAEGLNGLAKAFSDFEEKSEPAWKSAGTR
jgi:protease I